MSLLLLGIAGTLTACDLIERAASLASESDVAAKKVERGDEPTGDVNAAPLGLPAPAAQLPTPAAQIPAPGSNSERPGSFADLAALADSAVVYVRTIHSQRQGFRRVLTDASGSGFIFDQSGRILTNYHVVQGAHAISVELSDDRALIAELVGADPLTDLAVLKVDAGDLPFLPLGDSDAIRVGDWVVAIGNPYGLEHTVSAGIISAKERTGQQVNLGNPQAYYSFLQTDASINPGNSGGPLLDLDGKVVGINTAINAQANNIGFAIPVNMVKRLLPRLLKYGRIERAAIGVLVGDVTLEDVSVHKLKDRSGAYIIQVLDGSPAARAGLHPGDVVIEVDGHPVRTPSDFRWNASLCEVGKEVSLRALRFGAPQEFQVRPAPLDQ